MARTRAAWLFGAVAAAACAKGSGLETASEGSTGLTGEASTTAAPASSTGPADETSTGAESSTGEVEATGSSTGQVTNTMGQCGDGQPDPGEDCDDGNLQNNDACTNACKLPVCGDGFVLAGTEVCDDGNLDDTDDCTSTCVAAVCGDGFVHAGIEACDDGNAVDNDECTNACATAGCGDGIVQGAEECDDGNPDNTDVCTASCKNAACGDGILWIGAEECEDGNMVPGDGCENDCTKTKITKFTAVGPQTGVAEAALFGWTKCYSDTFANGATAVGTILAQCNKANLMLACRPVGAANFTLLAHAPREAVTLDTMQSNTPTNANGTGWYYSDAYSWGFAREGEPITRQSCDTGATVPEQRLCWHTGGGNINGGYRCGTALGLNSDGAWERVVLHAD